MRVTLALILAACAPGAHTAPHDDPRTRMTRSNPCADTLAALVAGDLARVHGLPATCTLADLAAALSPLDGEGVSELGEPPARRRIRYVRAPGLAEPVQAWLDGDRVVLVDVERPPTPHGWQAYVAPLGPPEARLDYAWSVLVLPGAEWVWPARGVVVAVKDSTGAVLRTGVFVPGTLAEYRRVARYLSDERDEPGG
ncbi:MAG TPA: hypothetical protein VF516_20095 [Kofleriaceae bacterium]